MRIVLDVDDEQVDGWQLGGYMMSVIQEELKKEVKKALKDDPGLKRAVKLLREAAVKKILEELEE